MIGPIKLEKTHNTPYIHFSPAENIFEIIGRSIPEDATKFFSPVMHWLEEYIISPLDQTVISIDLEYFNSSSAKRIMKILAMLEQILDTGKTVKVIWKYQEGDELIEERGIELRDSLRIPFELVTY